MLNYARHRAIEMLKITRRAVLVSNGPSGLQAGYYRCEALGLELYLLVPGTSDHLPNLEQETNVTLLSSAWELKGEAKVLSPDCDHPDLELTGDPLAKWCRLVRVKPVRMQVYRGEGWGNLETLDLNSE
jgi:hypothetical protein